MKNKTFPIILIIFFSVLFLFFYKGLQNSNVYIPENKIEKDIPNLNAQKFDTVKVINLKEIFENDKFYLLNIWASWCLPCRDEHTILMSLKDEKNIEIIGLNYKDDSENAKKFLKELKNPYKIILSDRDGTIAIEWGAYGVPESFLIYNKKIIKKIVGPINKNKLAEIKKLLK